MPNRPRTHVLEQLSIDAFSGLLTGPLGWLVRDIPIDYGIDVEVEIFDENGDTTAMTFKVQLKGMESPDHIGPFRDVKVDHLRYWSRFDVPVLLVAYDDSSKSVYGRWIHALDLDLEPGQEQVRIRFTEDDRIVPGDRNLRTVVEVVRRLKSGTFGRPYPVRIIGDQATPGQTHDFFSVARAVGLSELLRLDRGEFAFTVTVANGSTRVALPADVGSMTVTYDESVAAEQQLVDSMVLLAGLLASMNRYGEAIQMINRLIGHSCADQAPDIAVELATATFELQDHGTLLRLLHQALEHGHLEAGEIYLLTLRQMPGQDWLEESRDELEAAIEQQITGAETKGNSHLAARWAYNFAQFLFTKEARADARMWIKRALRLDPAGYGSRPEPQRLLAGISWFEDDFEASVAAYRRAVELGGIEAAGAQLADSLMYAGHYSEAHDVIGQVMERKPSTWRDIFVDAILTEVVEHLGIDDQHRKLGTPEGTVLTGLTLAEIEQLLIDGDALDRSVWNARCREHPLERATTIAAGAFLSEEPVLMAMAVHLALHDLDDQGLDEESRELFAHLLHDNPKVLDVLLSDDAPTCDAVEADLLQELGLRSLEITTQPPGVQLVSEYNIVVDHDEEVGGGA